MFKQKNFGQIIFKSRYVIFAGLFLVLGAVIFIQKYRPKEKVYVGSVTVEYFGEKGFKPERIVIKQGTTVTFKNLSAKSFWPASDFYPGNSNYAGFDPREPIGASGTWSFRFDNLGEWGFHDHLAPINKGIIIVTDQDVYREPPDNCSNLDAISYTQRQVCWYKEIKDTVKNKGVNEALKLVSKLYNKYPLFSQSCHDATHLIGDAAYREFRKGKKFQFTVETSYCGYGFYHGFIEAMLYTTADYSEVRNFCESVNSNLQGNIEAPNAIYSCYHGIGHSTFDAHDPSLWGSEVKMVDPAIATCEKVTKGLEQEKTKQCITGVFNALAIAYSNNLYNLKMNLKDPTWYCRMQKGAAKDACYIEVSMAFINSQMGNYNYKFTDGVRFIEGLKDEDGAKVSMFGLASDYVHLHADQENSQFVKNCMMVRRDLLSSCMKGTELAILDWGKPGEEYKRAIAFCGEQGIPESERGACYTYVFRNFMNLYSKEKRLSICQNDVSQELRDKCINPN